MEYIIELYEALTDMQRKTLRSLGEITHESKYTNSVIMKTDKLETILMLSFVKDIEKGREGTWNERKSCGERMPRMTPLIYETIKLTRALEESVGGIEKDKSLT